MRLELAVSRRSSRGLGAMLAWRMDPEAAPASHVPRSIEASNGLRLLTTTTGEGEVFARFYAGYDRAFVLENEKEGKQGFVRCFELNDGASYQKLSALYGPYCEVSVVAEDAGTEIGGANFIAMPTDDGAIVTANLSYIYVLPEHRGRGYLSKLFAATCELIGGLFPAAARPRVVVFIEQNDPFRMSAEDYQRDTEFTGLDQFARLRIWAKLGAKVVDFDYAQPPLSSEQEVDDTLLYSVLGLEGALLNACVLEGHLRRFFGVSVLKGAAMEQNAAAHAQLSNLRAACAQNKDIELLDPLPLLTKIDGRDDAMKLWSAPPPNFRAALAHMR